MTGSTKSFKDRARSVLFWPRLPFEVRSRLFFWFRRRSWPSRQPETFSQKLHWKMAHDRRPLLTTITDKVAARDYVAHVVGPEVLSELLAVESDPARLALDGLPAEFVVKPNHASGLVWIVSDRVAAEHRTRGDGDHAPGAITTARRNLDGDLLVATCRRWLSTDYSDIELEWGYRNIPRRIMVEELLVGDDGHIPQDYKLYVFNGHVRFIEVHSGRFDEHCCDIFGADWTVIDVPLQEPPADLRPPRPESLERMVEIAQALGAETDFVRVDLYGVADRVVFGELSSYPAGIDARDVYPDAFDREMGMHWRIPRRYDTGMTSA